jgi:murein DD-endopeptidase MepM/ murein hydrolase activator NlpD
MGIIISPTGKWEVRGADKHGQGYFGASRGNRKHNGIDLLIEPGQRIVSPIDGKVIRDAYPYAGDLKWSGCLIKGKGMEVKMFYMRLLKGIIGSQVKQGQEIGWAQNIAHKYAGMLPHVHLEIKMMSYVNPEDYILG